MAHYTIAWPRLGHCGCCKTALGEQSASYSWRLFEIDSLEVAGIILLFALKRLVLTEAFSALDRLDLVDLFLLSLLY